MFVDRDVISYGTCVVGKEYKEKIVLTNNHNVTLKFWADCIELVDC